ncbi:hypothetical protein ACFE04_027975 [Oxalis oulophora]
MANLLRLSIFVFMYFVAISGHFKLSLGFNPKNLTLSATATKWLSAGATWYGSPNGAGSTGGSCGYESTVSQVPFSSLVTAVGPSIYNSGKECGACFQVKCTKNQACSGKPVRVVITDSCPGCVTEKAHFDLSGTALGAMARPGQADKLRAAGNVQIQYGRVACNFGGKNIAFHVDLGSNKEYFAVVIEYEDGDGDLGGVHLMDSSNSYKQWRGMMQSWGAVWKLDAGTELHAPFSIQLTSLYSGQTIVARNVIPNGWKPGSTYRSVVNYNV